MGSGCVERHGITRRWRRYQRIEQSQVPTLTENELEIRYEALAVIVDTNVVRMFVPGLTLADEIDLLADEHGDVQTEYDRC